MRLGTDEDLYRLGRILIGFPVRPKPEPEEHDDVDAEERVDDDS